MQNIKNLIGNFGAIHVGIMRTKFQASSFNGVGGEWDDRHIWDVTPNPYAKLFDSPLRFWMEYFLQIHKNDCLM